MGGHGGQGSEKARAEFDQKGAELGPEGSKGVAAGFADPLDEAFDA